MEESYTNAILRFEFRVLCSPCKYLSNIGALVALVDFYPGWPPK
jgi:hypothetical protein